MVCFDCITVLKELTCTCCSIHSLIVVLMVSLFFRANICFVLDLLVCMSSGFILFLRIECGFVGQDMCDISSNARLYFVRWSLSIVC